MCCIYVCMYVFHNMSSFLSFRKERALHFDRKPPPRGGFLFTMFPNQEAGGRGPPSKHMVQILRGGTPLEAHGTNSYIVQILREGFCSFGFLIRERSIYIYIYTYNLYMVQILRGGFSSFGFLIRERSKLETPPGWEISFDRFSQTKRETGRYKREKDVFAKKEFYMTIKEPYSWYLNPQRKSPILQ